MDQSLWTIFAGGVVILIAMIWTIWRDIRNEKTVKDERTEEFWKDRRDRTLGQK